MLKTKIGRLRIVALLEGLSYIILLFIAMPIKYIGGDPSWVKVVGMAHGILFVLFLVALGEASREEKWVLKFNIYAFIASLLPFGTFHLDRKLKQPELIKNGN